MVKMLYLIRGLPGSGKSTFAKELAGSLGACHHEADQFFYFKDGRWGEDYAFDASKLWEAHKACQHWTSECLHDGCTVVVSNTLTTEKELKPYLDMAERYGYSVTSIIVENRHGNESIHDVPEETMQKNAGSLLRQTSVGGFMLPKEDFMSMMSALADMPHEQVINEVIPALLKQLPDDLLNRLHFALYVECQERFVAIGEQEPVDKYENIRGE